MGGEDVKFSSINGINVIVSYCYCGGNSVWRICFKINVPGYWFLILTCSDLREKKLAAIAIPIIEDRFKHLN